MNRIQKAKQILLANELDFLLIEDPLDIFYLTALNVSRGKIVLSKKDALLLVDGRYIDQAKKQTDIRAELLDEKTFLEFFKDSQGKILGFDALYLTYSGYLNLASFFEKAKKNNPQLLIVLKGVDNPLKKDRMVKDDKETALLKKAASLNWEGFEHICSLLQEGITEKEVALGYEIFCRRKGAEKLAFDPIICFGENSAYPHHTPSSTPLKKNEHVLIDIGTSLNHYLSDMTRVVFFGKPNQEIEKLYSVIKKAHLEVLLMVKPGVRLKDLDLVAKNVFIEEGVEDKIKHSLGHGIGLKIHEPPFFKEDGDLILKEGMVFTVEPGLYKEGLGGVRYEDTIRVTQKGFINFYPS